MKISISIDETVRSKSGLAKTVIQSTDLLQDYELDISFEDFYPILGIPDEKALDLLFVSSICYVVDKTVKRKNDYDGWTRNLEIEIPVSELSLWKKVSKIFNETLGFLSGDNWRVTFVKRNENLFEAPLIKRKSKKTTIDLNEFTGSCAFSGGMDSLIGAINLLDGKSKEKLYLIGHHDESGPASAQNRLFTALAAEYPSKSELLQVRVGHKPSEAKERTSRSRSFLFISIAVYVARAIGADIPVYIPENGFIALNMPLTPSRSSACSTRTMHPYFISKVRELLEALGIQNPLINPLESRTKGECVAECKNLKLFASVVNESVSCSSTSRKQLWKRINDETRNCGHCVPCLIRRASLHKAGLDSGITYGFDVCSGELKVDDDWDSANDLRAVINIIRQNLTASDYARKLIAVAPLDNIDEKADLIDRGINEITTLFKDKGDKSLLKEANLKAGKK